MPVNPAPGAPCGGEPAHALDLPAGLAVVATAVRDGASASLVGCEILVVGGHGGLSAALEFLGARVTVVEPHSEGELPHPDPFARFATVFVDVRDLTDPGGELARWAPALASHGHLVALMRHPLVGTPRRDIVRSLRRVGLRRLLAPAKAPGLTAYRTLLLLPDTEGQPRYLPPIRVRRETLAAIAPSRRAKIQKVAARLGLVRWTSREWLQLSVRSDTGARPVMLADEVVGGDATVIPRGTFRVGVDGPRRFVKVPLSSAQEQGVIAEVARTRAAAETSWAPYVLEGVSTLSLGGITAATYDHVDATPLGDADLESRVVGFLENIPDKEYQPLGATDLAERFIAPRHPVNLEVTGLVDLRRRVLERSDSAPVGPTHGDLNAGNVLGRRDGGITVIDWVRYEARSPLFIDAAFAALALHWQRHGLRLDEALSDFMDGTLTGPLAMLADRRSGGLSREWMAAWVILHEVSALQGDLTEGDSSNIERLRRAADVVRQKLA